MTDGRDAAVCRRAGRIVAEERLQKILATAGVASRRKAEVLITEGRVTVNGKIDQSNWAPRPIPITTTSRSTAA